MVKKLVGSILITFSFIVASLIGSLIIFFSILFNGYIFIVENNSFILWFEIIVFSFTLIHFIFLIPKIIKRVDNEI